MKAQRDEAQELHFSHKRKLVRGNPKMSCSFLKLVDIKII